MHDRGAAGRAWLVAAVAVVVLGTAPGSFSPASAQGVTAAADYQQRLQVYLSARRAFEAEADAYWTAIAEKRRLRFAKRRDGRAIGLDDYVLAQPPVYAGPARPVDPTPGGRPPRVERKPLPVVADFLKAAAEHYRFSPQRPATELAFKRAYARAASEAGLTREQAVRVYAFETGGNGTHDMQSGLSKARPGARAISTALGYNQLLTANSVNLMAEQGPHIVAALNARAARLSGAERKALEHKIAVVRRMVAVARSVPGSWSEQQKLAATPQGHGIHAMVLDVDVGPLLQTHKLMTSVIFARRKGYTRPLSAAELEMMNLTGDGNGFDMVTMPQALRERVPTANFFQRSGYERNPVAIRHNTVAKLLAVTDARMDSAGQAPGARELAGAFTTVLSSSD
ncbi:MAG: hypothetical protein DCC74_04445 [Proteobacteria bacterium]|nr:MAG: hypothetical protein DCC74_04445 [Pseudomonadota bacterium]